MKQMISLKVPAEPKAESVSHGNFDADLIPGETIETTDERVASWLKTDFDLKETGREEVKADEPAVPEEVIPEVIAEDYPDDFPSAGRDALVEANVPVSTARSLTEEQLVEYKGIGPRSARAIVEYFAAGGNE